MFVFIPLQPDSCRLFQTAAFTLAVKMPSVKKEQTAKFLLYLPMFQRITALFIGHVS